MKIKEKNKNNELIANFMGNQKVNVGYYGDRSENKWQLDNENWLNKVGLDDVGIYMVNVKKNQFTEWNEVKYHKSWDWLMPVVAKIFKIFIGNVADGSFLSESRIKNGLIEVDINKTYIAVVEFIEWYNGWLKSWDNTQPK